MNYTSQITQYNEPKSQLDGNLMSQVLAAKDQKYDIAEAKLDAQIAQMSNFGIDNPEVKERYGKELEKLLHTLDNSNLKDIGNKGVNRRIDKALGRMLTPEYLEHNAIHQANKRYEQEVEEIRKKDQSAFSMKNYLHAKRVSGYADYMQTGNTSDVNTSLLKYTPNVDVFDEGLEILKKIKNVKGEYETYTQDEQGNMVRLTYKNLTPEAIQSILPSSLNEQMIQQLQIDGLNSIGYNPEVALQRAEEVKQFKVNGVNENIKKLQNELVSLRKFGHNRPKEKELEQAISALTQQRNSIQNQSTSADMMAIATDIGISNLTNSLANAVGQNDPSMRITKHAPDADAPTTREGRNRSYSTDTSLSDYFESASSTVGIVDPASLNENEIEQKTSTIEKEEKEAHKSYFDTLESSFEIVKKGIGEEEVERLTQEYQEQEGGNATQEGLKEHIIKNSSKGFTYTDPDTGAKRSGLQLRKELEDKKIQYQTLNRVINDAYDSVDITVDEIIIENLKNNRGKVNGIIIEEGGQFIDISERLLNMSDEEIEEMYRDPDGKLKAAIYGRATLLNSRDRHLLEEKTREEVENETFGRGSFATAGYKIREDFIYNVDRLIREMGEDYEFTDIFDVYAISSPTLRSSTPENTKITLLDKEGFDNIKDKDKVESYLSGLGVNTSLEKTALRVVLKPGNEDNKVTDYFKSLRESRKQGWGFRGTRRGRSNIIKGAELKDVRSDLNQLLASDQRYRGNREYTFNGVSKDSPLYDTYTKLTEYSTEGGGMTFQPGRNFRIRIDTTQEEPALVIQQNQEVADSDKIKRLVPVETKISMSRVNELLNTGSQTNLSFLNFAQSITEGQTGPGHIYIGDVNKTQDNVSYFDYRSPDQMENLKIYARDVNPAISGLANVVIGQTTKDIMHSEMTETGLIEDPNADYYVSAVNQLIDDTSNIKIDISARDYGSPDSSSYVNIYNKEKGNEIASISIAQLSQEAGVNINSETALEIYNIMPVWYLSYAIRDAIWDYETKGEATKLEELLENAR